MAKKRKVKKASSSAKKLGAKPGSRTAKPSGGKPTRKSGPTKAKARSFTATAAATAAAAAASFTTTIEQPTGSVSGPGVTMVVSVNAPNQNLVAAVKGAIFIPGTEPGDPLSIPTMGVFSLTFDSSIGKWKAMSVPVTGTGPRRAVAWAFAAEDRVSRDFTVT